MASGSANSSNASRNSRAASEIPACLWRIAKKFKNKSLTSKFVWLIFVGLLTKGKGLNRQPLENQIQIFL